MKTGTAMESRRNAPLLPRGSSALSLHQRFSQVAAADQFSQSRIVTFDPLAPRQERVPDPPAVVLLVQNDQLSNLILRAASSSAQVRRCVRRPSVWTRLGWQRATRIVRAPDLRGFWSFRNKYRWSARLERGRPGSLRWRLGQRWRPRTGTVQKPTAGGQLDLRRGGATASRGRGLNRGTLLTKRQLDAQLDEYMSTSRRRLDAQLDEYMSTSKRRLDAELDEYMSMAGQSHVLWD